MKRVVGKTGIIIVALNLLGGSVYAEEKKSEVKVTVEIDSVRGLTGSELELPGTGVGNGTQSEQDAFIQRLVKELGPKVDLNEAELIDVQNWSGSAASALRQVLRKAQSYSERDADGKAKDLMKESLISLAQTLEVHDENREPITWRLIKRGAFMAYVLDEKLDASDRKALTTLTYFLYEYIGFIIDTEKALDQQYYQRYVYHHRGSASRKAREQEMPDFDYKDFQIRFLQYAYKQIELVVKRFSVIVRDEWDGRSTVRAFGNPEITLKLFEHVSRFAADDISGTIYGEFYRGVVSELDGLSAALTFYNDHGGSEGFLDLTPSQSDSDGVLNRSRESLDWVLRNLAQPVNHPRIRVDALGADFVWKQLDNGQFRISPNQAYVLDLGEEQYIEKVYVMAEARNADTTVEVYLPGGETSNGTLYLPRRDPPYYITLRDRTHQIEFKNTNTRRGTAIITEVHVLVPRFNW